MGRARRDRIARLVARAQGPAALLAVAGGWFAAGLVTGRRRRELDASHAEAEAARRAAAAADERASMLVQVGDTVRDLLSSPRTREQVCRAAIEIAGAHAAIIYEPGVAGALTCTAAAGLAYDGGEVVVDATSRAQRAFQVARPVFLAGAREDRVASVALWRAAGEPASVLYQPMVRAGRTLGILAAGWRDVIPFDGPQCAAVALLAHEAAAVIAHADAVASATGLQRTDPLTGLPNRQELEARFAAALQRSVALAVVTLDLDGFDAYTAAHGHAAGDRLLKAGVAGWRQALRADDCLARVGGEEFSVLLTGCGAAATVAIAERLRGLAPEQQTCSAGVAIRRDGETAEALLGRVQRALRDARSAGRGVGLSDPGAD